MKHPEMITEELPVYEKLLHTGRVLIVDDQPGNLQLIARQLTRHGYDILMAENWQQAQTAIQQVAVDLILLDINLPDVDGLEICQRLKKNEETSHIPIIFLSALSDNEDIIRGFRAGAVDYIKKPFNADELLARVDAHVELKVVRQKLLETNQKLELSNDQQARLISLIAHDLRNPFQHLRMFPEFVLESLGNLDPVVMQEVAENALREVVRVSSLLEELMEWSMVQVDQLQLNLHPLPLYSICQEVLTDAVPLAEEKGIQLDCQCDRLLQLLGDEKVLKTVLRNLISNAIKFTRPGGSICLSTAEAGHGFHRVSVIDNGVGISTPNLSRLFQLSEKFSRCGTQSEEGHGFGLYLCDQLLQRMGTQIFVSSTENQGATFFFYLPRAR